MAKPIDSRLMARAATALRDLARDRGENGAALIYDATSGESRVVVGDPFDSAFEVYCDPVHQWDSEFIDEATRALVGAPGSGERMNALPHGWGMAMSEDSPPRRWPPSFWRTDRDKEPWPREAP